MKIKKYILILLCASMVLSLSGCSKQFKINYDIDSKLSSLPSENFYPEELLNNEIQEKLKLEQTNDNGIIDHTLLNYKDATNKLPLKNMFLYTKDYYQELMFDWFGIEWGVSAYENRNVDMVSAIRLKVIYDIKDLEFAKRKSRELADKFLKTYNGIVYSHNIYEHEFSKLEESPIRIIADVASENLYAVLNIGIFNNTFDKIKTPYLEIVFVHKDNLHDIDDYELEEIIEYMNDSLKSVNIEPPFRTIKLDPYNGYIMHEPKPEENMTPEEILNSTTIFYNND